MMSNDERDGCIKSKWLSGALHMGLIVESMSGMFGKVFCIFSHFKGLMWVMVQRKLEMEMDGI